MATSAGTLTTTATGAISVSNVNSILGRSTTSTTTLSFLDSQLKPSLRAANGANQNMNSLRGMAYYQNTQEGNCTDSTANCSTNCACNCGNNGNCTPYNCALVQCTNCDSQAWLQPNCPNGNCDYNCNSNVNCFSHACNCSKIICTHLYDIGLMPRKIFEADQAFGEYLKANDPAVYNGYVRWAQIVVDGMNQQGPDFMFWVNKDTRKQVQQATWIKWAERIAKPWSEHMAYAMAVTERDNDVGRMLMAVGRPVCRLVNLLPDTNQPATALKVYAIWATFSSTYYVARGLVAVRNLFRLNRRVAQES